MKLWILTTVFTLVAFGTAAPARSAEPPLRLRVNTQITHAPADLLILAQVARDDANRWLTVQADSGDFFRSTTIQIDGSASAVTQQIWFKSLPAGDYNVTAELDGVHQTRARAAVTVEVLE